MTNVASALNVMAANLFSRYLVVY